MKYICLLFVVALSFTACQQSSGDTTSNTKQVKTRPAVNYLSSAQDFKSKIDATPRKQVIDLRTHGELHRIGPIPTARNIDFQHPSFVQIIEKFDKEVPTFVYCASGGRSASAYKKMKAIGFKEVYDLDGGITAWQDAGFPIQSHHH